MATTTFSRFWDELNRAGYQDSKDEYKMVIDKGDRYILLMEDNNEGGYIIGEFFKGDVVRTGDFAGCPLWQGESLFDALAFIKESI